jgi:ribosomal protein S1
MALQKEVLKKMKEYKKNKTILTGIVKVAQVNREKDKEELVVDINGIKGIIPKDEIDMEFKFKSLIAFVGTTVKFVVKSIPKDADYVICSRAMAQEMMAPEILGKLEDGEFFDGKVINILPYGAYIDIDGIVGLLKNTDFAEDYTSIKDMHHIGDTIKVKMKGRSSNDKLLFEAVTKYVSPTVITRDSLEPGQIVFGVVRNIQPWGVFVNIAPNLDALVDSEFADIQEDQKVSVRIKSVKQDADKFKVRGKIVSIL